MSRTIRPIAQLSYYERQAKKAGTSIGVTVSVIMCLMIILGNVFDWLGPVNSFSKHWLGSDIYSNVLLAIMSIVIGVMLGMKMSSLWLVRLKKNNDHWRELANCGQEFKNKASCAEHEVSCNLCSSIAKAWSEKMPISQDTDQNGLAIVLAKIAVVDKTKYDLSAQSGNRQKSFTAYCQLRFDSLLDKQSHEADCPKCLKLIKWRMNVD